MAEDDGDRRGSDVPPDVVIEILRRVPARSLCRFRCVSKLWRSIIADRGFMSAHWAHSRSRPTQLATLPCACRLREPDPNSGRGSDADRIWLQLYGDMRHDDSSLLWINLQPPPPAALTGLALEKFNGLGRERTLPSVGGLICLDDDCIKICNPSTWEYVALPDPVSDASRYRWASLCFDPIANEHKVLWSDGEEYRVFAPGSGTSTTSWRRIQGMPPTAGRFDQEEVCLNGILYFIAGTRFMAKFHVHSERFEIMISVDLDSLCGISCNWEWKLVEYLNARVAIVHCPRFHLEGFSIPPPSDYKDTIRLWVLEDEGRWGLQKAVLPSEEVLPRRGRLSLAGSIHAGEELVFLWTLFPAKNLFPHYNSCLFYNSKKETFSRLVELCALVPPRLNRPFYPLYTPKLCELSLADHEDNLLALEAFKLALN